MLDLQKSDFCLSEMKQCEKNVVLTETCTCNNSKACDASNHSSRACVVHKGVEACLNVITDGPTTHGACALSNTRGTPVFYTPEMYCAHGGL